MNPKGSPTHSRRASAVYIYIYINIYTWGISVQPCEGMPHAHSLFVKGETRGSILEPVCDNSFNARGSRNLHQRNGSSHH